MCRGPYHVRRMYMLNLLASHPHVYLSIVLTVILSITLHELAHGYTAIKLGDQTPIWQNRMTWNPIVHMGPFSLAACLLVGIAWGQMPVDHTRLRGKWAESYVALAGPLTNLLLAGVGVLVLLAWVRLGQPDLEGQQVKNGLMFLRIFWTTNLLLCVFNLLPIPPLDGSRVAANVSAGYARWLAQPGTQQVTLVLFILVAFTVVRVLAVPIRDLGWAYEQWLVGIV